MGPLEVVEKLEKGGIKVTRQTLSRYERQGLIPAPVMRNSRRTEYPPETIAEFYASWSIMHLENTPHHIAAEVRRMALEIENDKSGAALGKIEPQGVIETTVWKWLTYRDFAKSLIDIQVTNAN